MFYRIFTVVKKNCRTILKPIFSNLIHQNTHKHIHYLYIYIYTFLQSFTSQKETTILPTWIL